MTSRATDELRVSFPTSVSRTRTPCRNSTGLGIQKLEKYSSKLNEKNNN